MKSLRMLEQLAVERGFAGVEDAPGPASSLDMAELEAFLGPLPFTLRELLQWKNGCPADAWLGEGFWFLLSTSEIKKKVEMWRKGVFYTRGGSPITLSGSIPKDWIPFATWNADVYMAMNSDDHVLAVDLKDGIVREIAKSTEEFFSMVWRSLDQKGEFDVDELMTG